jgi:RNA polymerase sporulation-specific sigma factor
VCSVKSCYDVCVFCFTINVWEGDECVRCDSDDIGREIEQEDEKNLLMSLVERLPEREKIIMQMRFGLGKFEEFTQKQVADSLGISQSYISRLEKRIINKLKKQIEKATTKD